MDTLNSHNEEEKRLAAERLAARSYHQVRKNEGGRDWQSDPFYTWKDDTSALSPQSSGGFRTQAPTEVNMYDVKSHYSA